jgi:transcription antitermination protein NusB
VSELGAQRHRARERAVELLYEAAMKDRPVAVVVTQLPVPPDAYTLALLTSVSEHETQALELMGRYSIDWPVERMALLDKLILLLATGELMMQDAPPTPVILDEAVELAKTYSTDGSGSFVNGILSSIADDLRHN